MRSALVNPRLAAGRATVEEDFEKQLEHAIVSRIGNDRYNLWFREQTRFLRNHDTLTVGVPNLLCQEWLEKTFGDDVVAAVREVGGDDVVVRFAIDPELFREARLEQERVAAEAAAPDRPALRPEPATRVDRPEKAKPARRWRSLNDFIVGPCNRVAFASALSVVEEPGQGGNPLVFYGPVGTGKTHLLEGVYAGIRRRWPEHAVRYVTGEDFTNSFIHAMHRNRQMEFRKRFRDCEVLLVDDLDFLAGKKATQVEFLHTFDSLLADHKQIVVTVDCHPRLSDDLLPELVDRLIGGAVWSLLPPDAATRLELLKARVRRSAAEVPEDVLTFLAQQLRGNVRELEGAVHSLHHFQKVTRRPIDLPMAREALGELLRHAVKVVGMADIETAVCNVLRLPAKALTEKSRSWTVSHPRMLAIYLSRKHTAATYGEISNHFGNKTHSSAVAAEKRVKGWMQKGETIRVGDREWGVRDLLERVERELGR